MQCLLEILSQRFFKKNATFFSRIQKIDPFMQNLLKKICIAVHAEYAHER